MKITKLNILILITVLSINVFSQVQPRPSRPTATPSKWDKMFPNIKYGDKVYKTGSNWFLFGIGRGYSTNLRMQQTNMSLAYYHRYRTVYFNLGYHYSGKELFLKRPMEWYNDIHPGAGLRFENRWLNFGFFIGPSWAFGSIFDYRNEYGAEFYRYFHTIGAHTEIQLSFKYFYDLGIGTSIYGSFNKQYQVVGIQLHFYFSSAYVDTY